MESLGSDADQETSLQILEDVTSSPELNSEDTITESQEILDDIMENVNDTAPLSEESASTVA